MLSLGSSQTVVSTRRSSLIGASLVLAIVSGASLRFSRAAERQSDPEKIAVLQAKLERLADERRQLHEELASCERDGNRGFAPSSLAAPPVASTTDVTARRSLLGSTSSMPSLSADQRQGILRQRYGQLLRELALSPEQSAAVLEALGSLDPSAGLLPPAPPDPAREQAAITPLIGPDKAAEFLRLKLTLPARAELRAVRDRLEAAGEAVTQEQLDELTDVLSARARQLALPPSAANTGNAPEQRSERVRDLMDARERRFREAEASVLTPAQMQLLDAGRAPLRPLADSAAEAQAGRSG
jgi:hypothetical protein